MTFLRTNLGERKAGSSVCVDNLDESTHIQEDTNKSNFKSSNLYVGGVPYMRWLKFRYLLYLKQYYIKSSRLATCFNTVIQSWFFYINILFKRSIISKEAAREETPPFARYPRKFQRLRWPFSNTCQSLLKGNKTLPLTKNVGLRKVINALNHTSIAISKVTTLPYL